MQHMLLFFLLFNLIKPRKTLLAYILLVYSDIKFWIDNLCYDHVNFVVHICAFQVLVRVLIIEIS